MDKGKVIENLKRELELLNLELSGVIEGIFTEDISHLQLHVKMINKLIPKLRRE